MVDVHLKDRVAVVTGASRGLGRAMAMALAEAGARVALASPERANLQDIASDIESRCGRGRAIAVSTDITRHDDCEELLGKCLREFGSLHILVNCARRLVSDESMRGKRYLPFWEVDTEFWDSSFAVNVNGAFRVTRTVVPQMIKQEWGRIINITTSLSTMQLRSNSPYGVTKAALEAATLIWAQDLRNTGVTVNSLIPGSKVNPDANASAGDMKGLLPVQVMNPLVVWLASDLSDGKTGGRYVGRSWNPSLPPNEAAQQAMEPPVLREPPPRNPETGHA